MKEIYHHKAVYITKDSIRSQPEPIDFVAEQVTRFLKPKNLEHITEVRTYVKLRQTDEQRSINLQDSEVHITRTWEYQEV